jgi:putative glutamine amidotransferase
VLEGSRLHAVAGSTHLRVNSAHHQAIGRLGDGLVATGWAEDGCVEAIEWAGDDRWLVAVQYHPEDLHATDPAQLRLFTTFLERAREHARAGRGLDERTPCTT